LRIALLLRHVGMSDFVNTNKDRSSHMRVMEKEEKSIRGALVWSRFDAPREVAAAEVSTAPDI
jgi:hypothetical protein